MSGALPCSPGTPVELHGDLTIQVATERRLELMGLVDGCAPGLPCVLDVGQIVDVDSAGVQLLIALRRSLAERGSPLELAGTRGALRQALATYHLDDRLDPVDLAAPRPADRSGLTAASAGAHA